MSKSLDCLILCGGKGTRLGALGKKYPKSLLKFNNTTLLDKLIKKISNFNINQITLSCHYKYSYFVQYLEKMNYVKNIKCVNDGEISILERIKIHLKNAKTPLLVCYADEIANINISTLRKNHLKSKKLITITTYKFFSNFGFVFQNNDTLRFDEKPFLGNYNIGYFMINPATSKLIGNHKRIENFLNFLCTKKQLNEFVHNGKHITYNTFAEYEKVKNMKI